MPERLHGLRGWSSSNLCSHASTRREVGSDRLHDGRLPCSVRLLRCGGAYRRNLSSEEILEQIDYMVSRRYGSTVNVKKFKIQFARIGEPALNPSVLEALEMLPQKYDAPGLLPSISSIARQAQKAFLKSYTR